MNQSTSASDSALTPQDQNPKTLMGLLFSFYGRINRIKFLIVFLCLISIKLGGLFIPIWLERQGLFPENAQPVSFIIAIAITFIPNLAITVRRLHDQNLSGFFLLVVLIPYLGTLILMSMCLFMPGTEGDNQYGPDPKTS